MSVVGLRLAAAGAVVVVNPGDNIEQLMANRDPGTTYLLGAGMFRMQTVVPRTGDVFKGSLGANGALLTTLSGARLLTTFGRDGKYRFAAGQTQGDDNQVPSRDCLAGYPRCNYQEEFFFDDVAFLHVDSLDKVGPGKYFFDYLADRIYFIDDPRGHRVETSITHNAFSDTAADVTIQDLIVEKYASAHQMAAIGGWASGTGWTVQNAEVRWNHGVGIKLMSGGKVSKNSVHHNSQLGLGGSGLGLVIEDNEIYNNGHGGVIWYWEGGGSKWVETDGLIVRRNYSHHNGGPGLWTDIDNIRTLYEDNIVNENAGPGIAHEISHQATIRNNTLKNNGTFVDPGWLWDAAIQIATSKDADVYGNTIEVNSAKYAHGIALIQQNRGLSRVEAYGAYKTANNWVHDNTITVTGPNARGAAGVVQDFTGNGDVLRSANRFNFNSYFVPDLNATYFVWGNWMTWAAWRNFGQDANGTARDMVTNDTVPPVISAVSASAITASGATVTWTTNEVATGQTEFGVTTAYGSSTAVQSSLSNSHADTLTGLTANTLYHFRTKSADGSRNLATSGDFTFTTGPASADSEAPTVPAGVSLSNPTSASLAFQWSAASDNVGVAGYRLDVSSASDFATPLSNYNNKEAGAGTSVVVSGLSPSTIYYGRVRAYDAAGNVSANSATAQGVTASGSGDSTAPVLSAIQAMAIGSTQVTISWTTNEPASTQVEYGTSTAYGQSTALNSTLSTSHSQVVSGLTAKTNYQYRVQSRDAAGNLATSGNFTFKTAK